MKTDDPRSDVCAYPRCRGERTMTWKGYPLCEMCWEERDAADLYLALGLPLPAAEDLARATEEADLEAREGRES